MLLPLFLWVHKQLQWQSWISFRHNCVPSNQLQVILPNLQSHPRHNHSRNLQKLSRIHSGLYYCLSPFLHIATHSLRFEDNWHACITIYTTFSTIYNKHLNMSFATIFKLIQLSKIVPLIFYVCWYATRACTSVWAPLLLASIMSLDFTIYICPFLGLPCTGIDELSVPSLLHVFYSYSQCHTFIQQDSVILSRQL